MYLKQISVFIENKTGSVRFPCKVLRDAGINITTLTLADTKDFGILRIIALEWERAADVLKKSNFAVKTVDVVALEVDNSPGGLSDVLEKLSALGLNVAYLYASVYGHEQRAVLIFRFDDTEDAVRKISDDPELKIVDAETFFSLK